MPFIEIIDRDATHEIREVATHNMTQALCDAFEIAPEIVTCYYYSAPHYSYGHAAKYGDSAEKFRIFVKIHAFRRPQKAKNDAALAVTAAVVGSYGVTADQVVIYFMDRHPSDAFHAGLPSA